MLPLRRDRESILGRPGNGQLASGPVAVASRPQQRFPDGREESAKPQHWRRSVTISRGRGRNLHRPVRKWPVLNTPYGIITTLAPRRKRRRRCVPRLHLSLAPDGRRHAVQYFERARFEFHPANTPPYDVLPGLLGVEVRGVTILTTMPLPARSHPAPSGWVTPVAVPLGEE